MGGRREPGTELGMSSKCSRLPRWQQPAVAIMTLRQPAHLPATRTGVALPSMSATSRCSRSTRHEGSLCICSDLSARASPPCDSRRVRLRAGLRLLILGTVLVGSVRIADAQIQIQGFGRLPSGEQDPPRGVYLPTDRALSRAMTRARERLAHHEYHEALTFLHGILGREEDSFLERRRGAASRSGLKATARRLIGELPPEGHDAYELLHGATARRQLEAALRSGDRDGVAKVVRQFFHTSAGYEAALVLAQMEADRVIGWRRPSCIRS